MHFERTVRHANGAGVSGQARVAPLRAAQQRLSDTARAASSGDRLIPFACHTLPVSADTGGLVEVIGDEIPASPIAALIETAFAVTVPPCRYPPPLSAGGLVGHGILPRSRPLTGQYVPIAGRGGNPFFVLQLCGGDTARQQ